MEQLDVSGGDLEVETVRSLHECELEEKDLSEVLNQKNVMLEQITDKQESQMLKAVKQSTLLEAPDPPLPCFLRAHINKPLTLDFPPAAMLSAAATAPLFPSIPPRDMPLCAWAFPVQFNNPQPGHNQWQSPDFGLLTQFKKACLLYRPTSPYCMELLGARQINGFMQIFLVAKMVMTPQQLLQWQMWVTDDAKLILQEQQSKGNPTGLNFEILTGTKAMAKTAAQLQFVQLPTLYWIKEAAIRAWAKIDSSTSDGSFVKILQGPTEEYAQFIGKLKEAIDHSLKDASL